MLSADFAYDSNFDGVNYALELRSTTREDSCLTGVSGGVNRPGAVTTLLSSGSVELTVPVESGECMAYSLIVRNLITNNVMSYANVYIDNV